LVCETQTKARGFKREVAMVCGDIDHGGRLGPKRSSVRFEFDLKFSNIFHNYGHGGAGFTVAWGCAMELAEVLKRE